MEPNRRWDEGAHWFRDGGPRLRQLAFGEKLMDAAVHHTEMVIRFFEEVGVPIHPNMRRFYEGHALLGESTKDTNEASIIRLNRTVIYECPWVNLYRDKIQLPNGHIIDQYHLLDFGRGAVVVIVENDQGQILMERISRYPTGTTTWELPAGGIERAEDVIAAAEREVFEETGYRTYGHAEIYWYHPLNGISNMCVRVVACRAGDREGKMDDSEVSAFRWFNLVEVRTMIRLKEITDGLALTGLLLYLNGDEYPGGACKGGAVHEPPCV